MNELKKFVLLESFDKVIDEKAPPGDKWEKFVLKLKKSYPDEKAYAIAWSRYNKSKKESLSETFGSEPHLAFPKDKTVGVYIDSDNPDLTMIKFKGKVVYKGTDKKKAAKIFQKYVAQVSKTEVHDLKKEEEGINTTDAVGTYQRPVGGTSATTYTKDFQNPTKEGMVSLSDVIEIVEALPALSKTPPKGVPFPDGTPQLHPPKSIKDVDKDALKFNAKFKTWKPKHGYWVSKAGSKNPWDEGAWVDGRNKKTKHINVYLTGDKATEFFLKAKYGNSWKSKMDKISPMNFGKIDTFTLSGLGKFDVHRFDEER